jgi:hypothetical protein
MVLDQARLWQNEGAAIEVKIPGRTTVNAKLPVTATGVGKVDLVVWLESFSLMLVASNQVLLSDAEAEAEAELELNCAELDPEAEAEIEFMLCKEPDG